jgi:alcohol dehydrogenase class IV
VPAVFSDTVPEPDDTIIDKGVAAMNAGSFDCLIGFGGGSPIDTAKAMAILAQGGGKMRDYKVPFAADMGKMPVIAIPTTAGTGSECTRFTVITDHERDEKMLIAGFGCLPLAAIVDYELTFSVPPRTTADTGIDSFTHAIEAYVSKRANPFSDALALAAMELIGKHLRTAYAEPRDAAAREGMMIGATQAGLAFSNSSVALVHGMSRPIGAHFHVPHGLSNAMLMPAITRFSLDGAPGRYAEAARRVGFADAGDSDALAGAKQGTQSPDARRVRDRRGELEQQDGADGGASAGVGKPQQQPARAQCGGDCFALPRSLDRRRQQPSRCLSDDLARTESPRPSHPG